jgi:flavin reductase (DIM6/NTAB) family NADH-FMN oxidoreductase RutF
MFFDTKHLSNGENYQLMVQGIVPRPIAWISTISDTGISNLAPYSFFTGVSCNPPVLSISQVTARDGKDKNTLQNLLQTGECVVNIVSHELAEKMNQTSESHAYGVNEFDSAQLETVNSQSVQAFGVKLAKVRYECQLREVIRISSLPSGGTLVLLDILTVFVDDSIYVDNKISLEGLDAVGKLGGDAYSTTRDIFSLARP